MGIQINGITDTISATDGGLAVSGQQLTGVTDISASGIVTATQGYVVGTGASIFSPAANTLALGTNGSERVRVDSSGRLAIGTTSPQASFVVSNGGAQGLEIGWDGSTSQFLQAYNRSGSAWIPLRIQGSDIRFNISGSTNEKARIDSSGRLLVGISSASSVQGKVFVVGNSNSATGEGEIHLARGATPTSEQNLGNIHFGGVGLEKAAQIICKRDGGTWTSGASHPSRLEFSTTADGASSSTERMRIGQKGYLKVSNTGSYNDVSAKYHETRSDQDDWTLHVSNSHASNPYGLLVTHSTVKNNTSNWFLYAQEATTLRFQVRSNGGIANYQGNDTNLCDEREKKNIVDLDSTWNCLKNWELKKFHYNEDADTDDKRYGVIAQQVAEHCPEVITDWVKQQAEPAKLDEDGNELEPAKQEIVRMGVKEQQMYWMAIKALQEAQVRIETLEAEVAALKAS